MADPVPFVMVLTEAGAAAAIAQDLLGLKVTLTHLAFGAGQYAPAVNIDGLATQTALVDYRESTPLTNGQLLAPNSISMSADFPIYGDTPYFVGEVGVYAGDPEDSGILFGIFSAVGYVHTYRNTQIALASSYGLTFTGVPEDSVTVVLDPAAGTVDAAIIAHNADPLANPAALAAFRTLYGPYAGDLQFTERTTAVNSMWKLCNGGTYNTDDWPEYAAAFAIGDPTFNVPDYRGRVPLMAGTGSGLTNRPLGATGGVESVALTAAQMAPHRHLAGVSVPSGTYIYGSSSIDTPGAADRNMDGAGNARPQPVTSSIIDSATGTVAAPRTAAAQAHNNMQPWRALNVYIFLGAPA